MNLAAFMRHAALAESDREAVCVGSSCWATYGRLGARTAAIAGALRARGCTAGTCVALAMTNCPQFFETLFGAWHAGLVAVPINAKLHPAEFAYILDHSRARICFVTPDLAESIAGLADDIDTLDAVVSTGDPDYEAMAAGPGIDLTPAAPTDPAWLFYTTGTTGRPKGATLTHRDLVGHDHGLLRRRRRSSSNPATRIDAWPPRSRTVRGCYALSPCRPRRGCHVIPDTGHFDAGRDSLDLLQRCARRRPSSAAPTMVARLLNASGRARSVIPREPQDRSPTAAARCTSRTCCRGARHAGARGSFQLYRVRARRR